MCFLIVFLLFVLTLTQLLAFNTQNSNFQNLERPLSQYNIKEENVLLPIDMAKQKQTDSSSKLRE